jgi:hypothetical protein
LSRYQTVFIKPLKWRVNMLKNRLTHFLKELSKRKLAALCLFAVIAVFTACQDITGPEAGIPGARFSAAKVNQTVITNQAGLAAIQNDPTGDYVLGNSFALTDWEPICGPYTTTPSFSGTLDGAGYTITVQSFDMDALNDSNYIGIFAQTAADGTSGQMGSAVIENLTVNIETDPFKTPAQYVGALVGYAQGTLFTNITVNGKFTVDDTATGTFDFGGVAGYAGLITIDVDDYLTDYASIFTGITINANFGINYHNSAATVANIGGVAGLADRATLQNIRLNGALNTGYISLEIPEWGLLVNRGVFPDQAVVIPAKQPASGLFAGGVVGYVNASQISTVRSAMTVNALSATTAAYAGGVAGYAEGTNIYTSVNTADVTGNGPGYNTSAGGIAGYIVASRVRDSSASGIINATAESTIFGYDASWQAYAGGLVGYVGGSEAAPSAVERNYATGNVTTYAPFPYAGGLVGYLYGYNDFSNPAKNGSAVRQSYATGAVTATVQTDTADSISDIPYAGGLVGYSSVVESTIADSYATGDVLATTDGTYAWAGGVIGGNANDAVVTRTYSTSNVKSVAGTLPPLYAPQYADAGPAAGGIAGFNYYTAKTTVSYSVALNNIVNGNQSDTQNVVHRVAGSIGNDAAHTGTLTDNLANENMTVGDNWESEIGQNLRDGANTASQPAQSVYADLGWDFRSVWTISGSYPILQWK